MPVTRCRKIYLSIHEGAVWAASSFVRKTGVISNLSNYISIIYINGIIDRYIYLWLAPQSCSSLCFPRRLLQNSEHSADQYLDWLEDALLGSLQSCDQSYRLHWFIPWDPSTGRTFRNRNHYVSWTTAVERRRRIVWKQPDFVSTKILLNVTIIIR